MSENGSVEMGRRDLDRYHVVRTVMSKKLTQEEGAELLGLSARQVRRLVHGVRADGARGVVHGLKGRASNRCLSAETLEKALSALHDPQWEGFGPSFAKEQLEKRCSIVLGKETVRRLMTLVELWTPGRRRGGHRAWRERRRRVGMLVQLDGSDHAWLESRGPRCALVIFIDDATSRILHGAFVPVEDTMELLCATRTYLARHGRPWALYVDRDSICKVNRSATAEEELSGKPPATQFSRAMAELGIEMIFAWSPQAKGRVERGFKTHQDRLVKELRLAGIGTLAAANAFLEEVYIPEHNARYAVEPAEAEDAHRPLERGVRLEEVLCVREERRVGNDHTVRFESRCYQLLKEPTVRVRPGKMVQVEKRLDGSLHMRYRGRTLGFCVLPDASPKGSAPRGPTRRQELRPGSAWRAGRKGTISVSVERRGTSVRGRVPPREGGARPGTLSYARRVKITL